MASGALVYGGIERSACLSTEVEIPEHMRRTRTKGAHILWLIRCIPRRTPDGKYRHWM